MAQDEKLLIQRIEALEKEIAEYKKEIEILRASEYDALTGAYTREAFIRYAGARLCEDEMDYSLIMTDIEHYKHVVSRFGIDQVNNVLKMIASFILGVDDSVLCGRYSADRFVFLIHKNCLETIKEKNDAEIKEMLKHFGIRIKTGIVETVNKSEPITTACDHAFSSIRLIKHQYGQYVKVYDAEVDKQTKMEVLMEETMQDALSNQQFHVYYQPKIDLKTGKIGGAEALVRWIHPELGFVSPGMFIPLFERNGFISELDKFIWEQAVSLVSDRIKRNLPVVPISINVSRRDFDHMDLVEGLTHLVDRYGVDHKYIHIEVTESSYSDHPERVSYTINTLHDSGFVIELDDFGSGYTSLSSLTDMQLDILKVDMSLLQKDKIESERNILDYAFQLAKLMNFKTVQEGVETEEQNERMKTLECDYIQGYYYSKPLDKASFEAYIDAHA